jgi:hypothetical protein
MSLRLEQQARNPLPLRVRAIAFDQRRSELPPNTSPGRGGRPPSEAEAGGWGVVRMPEILALLTPTRLAARADPGSSRSYRRSRGPSSLQLCVRGCGTAPQPPAPSVHRLLQAQIDPRAARQRAQQGKHPWSDFGRSVLPSPLWGGVGGGGCHRALHQARQSP